MRAAEAHYPDITKCQRRFPFEFVEYEERVPLTLNGVSITPYEVKHPSGAPPYALRFGIDGKVLSFTGDTGWTESLCPAAQGADLLISECFQYDVTLPIHLDYKTIDANYERLRSEARAFDPYGRGHARPCRQGRPFPLHGRTGWHDARSMRAEAPELDRLLANIRACRRCVEAPDRQPLPHEPRPVLRVSRTARLAVCSQAPGTRVHASGIPFTDASGDRLRDWMGVSPQEFYDEARVAIIPMGFCFPGQDAQGRRPSAANRVRQALASILVRSAAAARARACGRFLFAALSSRSEMGTSLQATMLDWRKHLRRKNGPRVLPLPHPSWRNNAWLKRNPWFEDELLPVLRTGGAQTHLDAHFEKSSCSAERNILLTW